jgi:hypothetical protein
LRWPPVVDVADVKVNDGAAVSVARRGELARCVLAEQQDACGVNAVGDGKSPAMVAGGLGEVQFAAHAAAFDCEAVRAAAVGDQGAAALDGRLSVFSRSISTSPPQTA